MNQIKYSLLFYFGRDRRQSYTDNFNLYGRQNNPRYRVIYACPIALII